ncbi:MAG: molybdate ABC transporter substrate-binding protein [Sphingomonadaceae bacterium]
MRVRVCVLFLLASLASCSDSEANGPLVLAPSSMQGALDNAADAWAGQGHERPVLSFGASSAMARQVTHEAPADLFLSADEKWMDAVQDEGFIREGSRRNIAGNSLVLIAPQGAQVTVTFNDAESWNRALGNGRLAMGDPDAVPAGRYGKASLEYYGLWQPLENRIAPAENVRAALAMVERRTAPLGIVYATDAKASDKVEIVLEFADESHPPIRYPAALIQSSQHPDARGFLDFLSGSEASDIFRQHGFSAP